MQSILKRLLKYTSYSLLYFVLFILLYLLTVFCLSRISVSREDGTQEEVAIYIKTNGVHTDIVVPVANEVYDWSKEVKFHNTHLKDSASIQWLAVGWGDKGFYLHTPQWSDLTFSTAFKAAFALGTTAMHTTFYNRMEESKSCKKILISREQYKKLVRYIDESFLHNSNGHKVLIVTNANYGDSDAFYEGTGKYSLFKTCNSWANTALKSCGQKACLWTAFDTGIFLQYEKE
jgi:uncharacterized protein (TIGR02117 family)